MTRKNHTILITGGGGYIGTLLVEKLSKLGFFIRVFDTFYFGNSIKKSRNIEIVKGDIRKPPEDLFRNVEAVIHLDALSNDPTADFNPNANLAINTTATINLAKAAKKAKVKKFIFASSCSIYDLKNKDDSIKNEESSVNPTKAYSVSKYSAEKQILKLADKSFCVAILRKGTVFGFSPRMRYDLVVNAMVKDALSKGIIKVFSKGLEWRPLVEVNDVARAYFLALSAPSNKINKQIINISLKNFQIMDVAEIVQKTLKQKFNLSIKIHSEESITKARSYRVSNQKAKDILGFRARVTFGKSVINLVDQIKKGRVNDFENPLYYNITWMKPILEKEI